MIELSVGDVTVAVTDYLKDDPGLTDRLTASAEALTRIFGYELPGDQAQAMPRAALVVSPAGGFTEGLPDLLDRARIDIRHYGESHDQAMALAVLVQERLRVLRRYVANDMVLHSALRAGGFIPLREQVGDWPLVLRSYFVLYDVRSATAGAPAEES